LLFNFLYDISSLLTPAKD